VWTGGPSRLASGPDWSDFVVTWFKDGICRKASRQRDLLATLREKVTPVSALKTESIYTIIPQLRKLLSRGTPPSLADKQSKFLSSPSPLPIALADNEKTTTTTTNSQMSEDE